MDIEVKDIEELDQRDENVRGKVCTSIVVENDVPFASVQIS